MRIEKFICDTCGKENEEKEEFKNQVILAGFNGKVEHRQWSVCPNCLELVTEYILDNCEKSRR